MKMHYQPIMLLLLTLFTTFSAAQSSTVILPPSQDPFYVPPVNYALSPPGAILRVRAAPGNLSTLFNASAAYHILYRTTDSRYNASSAVTTLFVPKVANGSSLLVYGIPYDSASVDASPSYALYSGGVPDIVTGLAKGWFVTTSDYEGPKASFVAGVQSGHATLDATRAVLASGFGLGTNTKYALWGYSGGALASEWAAELQTQYAPELSFAGAALGGLTPNVSSVMMSVDGTIEAGINVAGILGLASQYPEYQSDLIANLKTSGPYNATTFLSARNLTLGGTIGLFAGQNVSNYFTDGVMELVSALALQVIYNDGIMGYHGVPQMPIFAYKAIGDELSPVADTDALVNRYCLVGADILYNRNTIGSHTTEAANGGPRALAFLSSVFAGTWSQTGCSIRNVTNSGNSSALF